MSGLWRKELRSLLPIWFLVLFIYGFDLLYVPLTEYPDQSPFISGLEMLDPSSADFYTLISFFLCFSLASGLLVGEKDNGTIRFLDGLPTNRNRVFWTKLPAAYLVLVSGLVIDIAGAQIFHLWSATSLDSSHHWRLAGTALFLHACQMFVLLSLGLACSFLRRFGWILAAMAVFLYLSFHKLFPQIIVLNPIYLVQPVYEGQRWILPGKALAVQLPLGCLALLFSQYLFVGRGLGFSEGLAKLKTYWWGRTTLGCGAALALLLWLGLVIFMLVPEDDPGTEEPVSFADWKTIRVHTDHYQFSVPKFLESKADPLIERADAVHEQVRLFLDSAPVAGIIVDGTATGGGGYAGLAFWRTIRLSIATIAEPAALEAVLGHETTHVYIEHLSQQRMGKAFTWTRFFHEGLAEYVEHRFFKDGRELEDLRFQAAVLFDRNEVRMEDLMDDRRLAEKQDPFLAYSLGERFISALVDRYGDASPSRVLKAMGREDAPKSLVGETLWRDAFQAAGYNFDETVNRFYTLLSQDAERFRDRIDTLPRLFGSVIEEGGRIGIRVEPKPPEDMVIHCQLRQSVETEQDRYRRPLPDENGTFWVSRQEFPTLQFQIGIRVGDIIIFEPWTEVSIQR